MNNEDIDSDDKIDKYNLEDASMEENTTEEIDLNEYQENNEVLVEEDKEMNEIGSEELGSKATIEDKKNSTSNDTGYYNNYEEVSITLAKRKKKNLYQRKVRKIKLIRKGKL